MSKWIPSICPPEDDRVIKIKMCDGSKAYGWYSRSKAKYNWLGTDNPYTSDDPTLLVLLGEETMMVIYWKEIKKDKPAIPKGWIDAKCVPDTCLPYVPGVSKHPMEKHWVRILRTDRTECWGWYNSTTKIWFVSGINYTLEFDRYTKVLFIRTKKVLAWKELESNLCVGDMVCINGQITEMDNNEPGIRVTLNSGHVHWFNSKEVIQKQ